MYTCNLSTICRGGSLHNIILIYLQISSTLPSAFLSSSIHYKIYFLSELYFFLQVYITKFTCCQSYKWINHGVKCIVFNHQYPLKHFSKSDIVSSTTLAFAKVSNLMFVKLDNTNYSYLFILFYFCSVFTF